MLEATVIESIEGGVEGWHRWMVSVSGIGGWCRWALVSGVGGS